MKKLRFSLFSLLAVAIVGCQSDDLIPSTVDPDGSQSSEKILIQASSGTDTRIGFEDKTDGTTSGVIALTWENEGESVDSFTLYDASGDRVGDFKYIGTHGEASGTFEQDGDFTMTDDATYTAVIPAVSYATLAERDAALTTESQTVTDVEKLDNLNGAVRLKTNFTYDEDSTSIAFAHEVSVLELTVTMPSGIVPSSIAITDGDNTATVTLPSGLTLTDDELSLFVAIEANSTEEEREISFNVLDALGNSYIYSNTTTAQFAAGVLYHASITVVADMSDVTDYYTDGYTAGNGVTYSSATSGMQCLTTTTEISEAGVYFLDPENENVSFTVKGGVSYSNLVIIGRYSNSKPKVTASGIIAFAVATATGSNGGMIYKNIDFTGYSENYTFAYISSQSYVGVTPYWIIDDCNVTTASDKSLSYFNDEYGKGSISNIIFKNNKFNLVTSDDAKAINIAYLNTAVVSAISKVEFANNVIYSSTDYYVSGSLFYIGPTTEDSTLELTLKNNTFVNYVTTGAVLYMPGATSVDIDKNIFWGDSTIKASNNLMRFTYSGAAPSISLGDNLAYGLYYGDDVKYYWRHYNGLTTYPTENNSTSYAKSATDPFTIFNKSTGIFIPSDTSYGSSLR